MRNRY